MRFLYGFIAIAMWAWFLGEFSVNKSEGITMLTFAIVAAGAMAGGA